MFVLQVFKYLLVYFFNLVIFLTQTMLTGDKQLQPEPSSCEEIHRNAKEACLYYKDADRCGSCGFGLEKGKITTSLFYKIIY